MIPNTSYSFLKKTALKRNNIR